MNDSKYIFSSVFQACRAAPEDQKFIHIGSETVTKKELHELIEKGEIEALPPDIKSITDLWNASHNHSKPRPRRHQRQHWDYG